MKIALMESLGISPEELAVRKAPFEAMGHTFVEFEKTTDLELLCRETADIDVMILANMPMPAAAIAAAKQLKYIDIAFTGIDHVAMDAVRKRDITASNASGYSNEAVAELSIGMAITLLRNIRETEQKCRTGGTKVGLVGRELKGKTVGIIGVGKIGKRSAELFHAFGCNILGCSARRHDDWADYIRQVNQEELLRESDVVVLHCPLNASTRGMIGKAQLETMKKTAILINLARGPVCNAKELADALERGTIAGAGIDVFDREPPLDENEHLLHAPNTLLTPHIAFASEESMSLRAEIVFDNLKAWLDGNPVNLV